MTASERAAQINTAAGYLLLVEDEAHWNSYGIHTA